MALLLAALCVLCTWTATTAQPSNAAVVAVAGPGQSVDKVLVVKNGVTQVNSTTSSGDGKTSSGGKATQGGVANATMGTIARSNSGSNVTVDKLTFATDGNSTSYSTRSDLPLYTPGQDLSFSRAPACSSFPTSATSQAGSNGLLCLPQLLLAARLQALQP
ncbi:hypothetical protein V8C86DRAFT_2430983 [Haematococcus lacustris]